jgi:hypothetical protein
MRIRIQIAGVTELICNRFTDEAAQAATDGVRGSSAAADRGTPREISEKKLYISHKTGRPTIPTPNLLRCIVDGGKFTKSGKSQLTTAKSSILMAALDIEGSEIEIIHKDPWRVDTRPVRNPSTGGRFNTHRPMFDDWSLVFTVDLDTSIIGPKTLRTVIDDAGKKIGLGDFRPSCKGPFGKFVVTKWEVIDPEASGEDRTSEA